MRITDFLFNIIDKFSPMSEADRNELRRDANIDYQQHKDSLKATEGKPKDVRSWIVFFSEKWEVRTVLALAYIWAVRKVHDWLNPEEDFEEYEEEDED